MDFLDCKYLCVLLFCMLHIWSCLLDSSCIQLLHFFWGRFGGISCIVRRSLAGSLWLIWRLIWFVEFLHQIKSILSYAVFCIFYHGWRNNGYPALILQFCCCCGCGGNSYLLLLFWVALFWVSIDLHTSVFSWVTCRWWRETILYLQEWLEALPNNWLLVESKLTMQVRHAWSLHVVHKC